MSAALSPVKRAQLAFWTAFSERLCSSSFSPRKPAAKNWYYLAAGVDGAKLALTVELDAGRIGCKLVLDHAPREGIADVALLIFDRLLAERAAIEAELGVSDLQWGVPTPTRVYRYRSIDVSEEATWPQAFDWLIDTAEGFRDSFGPRVAAIGLRALPPRVQPDDVPGSPAADLDQRPSAGELPVDQAPAGTEVHATSDQAETRRASDTGRFEAPLPYTNEDILDELDKGGDIERLGQWSEWVPLDEVLERAPRVPGVYMAREGPDGPIIYVGMAGERAGSGRPQGIRGRLNAYLTGKGVVSGLGEAAMDRALADPHWLRERLTEAESGRRRRVLEWGREALIRANVHFRWIECADRDSALALEQRCHRLLASAGLWNRRI